MVLPMMRVVIVVVDAVAIVTPDVSLLPSLLVNQLVP